MTATLPTALDAAHRPTPAGMRFVDVRANLMPEEILAARRVDSVRRRALIGIALAVALVVAGFGAAWLQTNSARDDLASARSRTTQLTLQQRRFAPLAQAQAGSQSLKAKLGALMTDDLDWAGLLQQLRSAAPAGVNLTSVTGATSAAVPGAAAVAAATADPLNTSGKPAVGTLTIIGTAPDKTAVAAYSDALSRLTGVAAVLVTSVGSGTSADGSSPGSGSGVTFTASAQLTTAILGGRFTTATTGGK